MKKGITVVVGILLGFALLFFLLAPGVLERGMNRVQPADEPEVTDAARAFHQTLLVGDLHTDSALWNRDLTRRSDQGHVDVPRLIEGNVALQVFTSVTKSPAGQNYEENDADARDNITMLALVQLWPMRTWQSLAERAIYQAERIDRIAEAQPDQLQMVRNQAELARVLERRAQGEPVVGAILGTEGSHALDSDLANVDRLYDAGLRIMGLQHFFDNALGGSLHGLSGAGLSDFGREAVTAMLERNMIIDVAHSSEAVVDDVLAMTDKPLIVSHTGFSGQCDTPRNISDDTMKAIAAEGGLIGVGYWDAAVCDVSVGGIVDAIRYGIDLVGEDHVALGSDYDGSTTTPMDTSGLELLTAEMLARDFSETEIRKVMGENLARFLASELPER